MSQNRTHRTHRLILLVVAVVTSAILDVAPAQLARAESGRTTWSGDIYSSHGFDGSLSLSVSDRGGQLEGTCALEIYDEEQSSVYTGALVGTLTSASLNARATLAYDDHVLSLTFQGQEGEGGSFSERAFFGSYAVEGKSFLGDGVFILWQFAQRN